MKGFRHTWDISVHLQERGRRPVLPVSRSRSSSSSATPPLSLLHNSPPLQQPAWNFGTAESGARVETPGGRPGNSSSGWAGDGPLQEDGAVSAGVCLRHHRTAGLVPERDREGGRAGGSLLDPLSVHALVLASPACRLMLAILSQNLTHGFLLVDAPTQMPWTSRPLLHADFHH
jgi:hypothetical protein